MFTSVYVTVKEQVNSKKNESHRRPEDLGKKTPRDSSVQVFVCARTRACLCPTLGRPGHPRPLSQPHAPYTAPCPSVLPRGPSELACGVWRAPGQEAGPQVS